MKLQLTIPSKPGFLHMLPGLDVIALLLIYPLMGASLVQETGIGVTLHESPWSYGQSSSPVVVTLGAGQGSPLWVNKKLIQSEDLESEITKIRESEDGSLMTSVVLRSDVAVSSRAEKEVMHRILKLGLDCKLLGKPVEMGVK